MTKRKTRASAKADPQGLQIDPDRLKAARLKKGWTQAEFGFHSKVDSALLSRLENGKAREIGISILGRIADTLGCSLDWICGR